MPPPGLPFWLRTFSELRGLHEVKSPLACQPRVTSCFEPRSSAVFGLDFLPRKAEMIGRTTPQGHQCNKIFCFV